MNETQKEKVQEAHGRLAGWLEGLGVPANWAKVGAGIIIGAVVGALATCQPSCSRVTPEQLQAGLQLLESIQESTIYKVQSTKYNLQSTKGKG